MVMILLYWNMWMCDGYSMTSLNDGRLMAFGFGFWLVDCGFGFFWS